MRKEIITNVDPKSPVAEIFRSLMTNLQYLNKKDRAQSILLTSTVQGEGKSFVASNLAVTYAQAGRKVILMDLDMRKPHQHKIFNTDMSPGLSNYLSGIDMYRGLREVTISECIYSSAIENLSILPAGNIPPNPYDLLQSEKLEELIDNLKDQFDIVIVDGVPCLIVTDSILISRLVDETVLVCHKGKTKIEDLKEAKKRINQVGGNVVGVVLNRIKISNRKLNKKYYYYSKENDKVENEVILSNKNKNDENNDSKEEATTRRKEKKNDFKFYNRIEYEDFKLEEKKHDNKTIKEDHSYIDSSVDKKQKKHDNRTIKENNSFINSSADNNEKKNDNTPVKRDYSFTNNSEDKEEKELDNNHTKGAYSFINNSEYKVERKAVENGDEKTSRVELISKNEKAIDFSKQDSKYYLESQNNRYKPLNQYNQDNQDNQEKQEKQNNGENSLNQYNHENQYNRNSKLNQDNIDNNFNEERNYLEKNSFYKYNNYHKEKISSQNNDSSSINSNGNNNDNSNSSSNNSSNTNSGSNSNSNTSSSSNNNINSNTSSSSNNNENSSSSNSNNSNISSNSNNNNINSINIGNSNDNNSTTNNNTGKMYNSMRWNYNKRTNYNRRKIKNTEKVQKILTEINKLKEDDK